MYNKIWYEIVEVKYGENYLSKYIDRQRTHKKFFKIMTLIVSLSGILGWKYFENYVWIAFVLIAILQLSLLIENEIIRSDKEIEEITNLRMLYTKYFNKLEKLWTKFNHNQIDEINAMDKFFELRQSDWENIELLGSKLNIKIYNTIEQKAEIETKFYLKKYHSNEEL